MICLIFKNCSVFFFRSLQLLLLLVSSLFRFLWKHRTLTYTFFCWQYFWVNYWTVQWFCLFSPHIRCELESHWSLNDWKHQVNYKMIRDDVYLMIDSYGCVLSISLHCVFFLSYVLFSIFHFWSFPIHSVMLDAQSPHFINMKVGSLLSSLWVWLLVEKCAERLVPDFRRDFRKREKHGTLSEILYPSPSEH